MLTSELSPRLPLRAEHGMTLIELLVSVLLSIIVISALLAILEFSLRQETRISDQVQSDRIGRTAMTNIIDELHSSCTGFGTSAIQAPSSTPTSPLASSNAVNLWFLSAYGSPSSANAVLTGVTEHDITWTSTGTSSTGQTLGTLTDYSFKSIGGKAPEWTFRSPLSVANAEAKVLAKNIIPPSGNTVFQYYKYNSSGALVALTSKELPLTTTTAPEIASVSVAFTATPENADTRFNRTAPFSSSVLLRFGPSESGSEAENSPCAS